MLKIYSTAKQICYTLMNLLARILLDLRKKNN